MGNKRRVFWQNRRLHTSKFSFIISFLSSSPIAQSVERRTVNPQVAGSSPARGAKDFGATHASEWPFGFSGARFLVPVFDACFPMPAFRCPVFMSWAACRCSECGAACERSLHPRRRWGGRRQWPVVVRSKRLFLACDASRVCRIMVAGRPGLACFLGRAEASGDWVRREGGGCRGWNRGSWTKKTHRRDRTVRVSGQRQDDAAQPPAAGTGLFGRGGDHQRVWRRGRGPPPGAPGPGQHHAGRGRLPVLRGQRRGGRCVAGLVHAGVAPADQAISPRAHRDQRPGRPGARVVHAEARSLPGRALCLSRRHRGRGCAAWRGQLADQPEAARQLALADTVVFSKADLAEDASLQAPQRQVEAINPGARRCVQRQDSPLVEALAGWPDAATRRAELSNWLRAFAQPVAGRHGMVSSFSLTLDAPIGRAAFLAGISLVQERYGQGLLRLKGLVCFEGETLPCEVHGVHGELYPCGRCRSGRRTNERPGVHPARTGRGRGAGRLRRASASCPHETVGARIAPFAVSHVRKMHGNTV